MLLLPHVNHVRIRHQITTSFFNMFTRGLIAKKINGRVIKWINPFPACWYIGWLCLWLRDCPQNFTFALEASLLCQMFIFFLRQGHNQPIYQPPEGVYLLNNGEWLPFSCTNVKIIFCQHILRLFHCSNYNASLSPRMI